MSSILALWMISWCLPSPRSFTSHLPSEVSTGSPLMKKSTGAPGSFTSTLKMISSLSTHCLKSLIPFLKPLWCLTPRGADLSSPIVLAVIMPASSSLQFLIISFLFLPSATIWTLLPSGIISLPSLNHFTGASSSSTPSSKTAVSSSTTFLPWRSLVKLCWNSAISSWQTVSLSPSLAKSWMTHLYSPASPISADLISSEQTPSLFFNKNLGSLPLISFPSLYHLTLASGLSTAHFISTFLLVFPFFFSSSFFLNPYSGSGGSTSR